MAPGTRSVSAAEAAGTQPGPTQAPANLSIPQAPSLTQEQVDARFILEQRKVKIELRRAEADLAAVNARTARENKESRAKIAAIQAGAITAAAPRPPTDEVEEPIGEIPPAALLVASRYPGLPKAEIARIFTNKFRPENLYKLRHLKGREDKDRDENITIENGQMKLKRVTGSLRDFGPNWEIWSESFLNYAMVMVDFFGPTFPSLCRALLLFHAKVRKLSKIYEWQSAILPLALDFHTEITTTNHTDIEAWSLPQDWIDQYCSPHHVLSSSLKKRSATASLDGPTTKKPLGETVCRNFNTKGCTWDKCAREHKCTECSSKEHGAATCNKKQ